MANQLRLAPARDPDYSTAAAMSNDTPTLAPGTSGERALQAELGTTRQALAFYNHQVLDHLNGRMREYVARQEFLVIATAGAAGDCDSSLRTGPPGFVHVLDERQLLYPDFRGNGVLASLGNILENPRIGMLFLDMYQTQIGLHVNGSARILTSEELPTFLQSQPQGAELAQVLNSDEHERRTACWVLVDVHEAYIHCSKHIPRVERVHESATKPAGFKGGDHFAAKLSRARCLEGERR